MKKHWMMLSLVGIVLLGGCRRQDTTVQRNVVTEITITCQTESGAIQRKYTSQDKMRAVLLYIRSIESWFTAPDAPGETAGEEVCITTVSADHTVKTYRQYGNRFFCEGEGNWKLIEPEKGANLWMIIKLLPSDPE